MNLYCQKCHMPLERFYDSMLQECKKCKFGIYDIDEGYLR